MKALQLLSKMYNNRLNDYNRSQILKDLDEPEQLFDFSKPIMMDDLSYLKNEFGKVVDYKFAQTLFKKEFVCKPVESSDSLSFVHDEQTYFNKACCFRSNI